MRPFWIVNFSVYFIFVRRSFPEKASNGKNGRQKNGDHNPQKFEYKIHIMVEHEFQVTRKSLYTIDPHYGHSFKNGNPQDSEATSISIHEIKHILARI